MRMYITYQMGFILAITLLEILALELLQPCGKQLGRVRIRNSLSRLLSADRAHEPASVTDGIRQKQLGYAELPSDSALGSRQNVHLICTAVGKPLGQPSVFQAFLFHIRLPAMEQLHVAKSFVKIPELVVFSTRIHCHNLLEVMSLNEVMSRTKVT